MADEPNKIIYSMIKVSKFHDKKPILQNISLSYFYGAKIGVLGMNGSGKSTLLKILAGVDKDFQGETVLAPGYTVGYLTHMGVMGQSPHSVNSSKAALRRFIRWCQERSATRPSHVDRAMVERYQQSLFHHRKTNGEPLTARSQQFLLIPVRLWFSWMAKKGYLPYSPAAELELPKVVRRLPKAILSAAETEAVLAVPDVDTPVIPENVRQDAFIAAVGSFHTDRAEIPAGLVRRCRLFVDDLDSARTEAGDLILAGVDWKDVTPLEAVPERLELTGPVLYKSVGHAALDLAAARLAFANR